MRVRALSVACSQRSSARVVGAFIGDPLGQGWAAEHRLSRYGAEKGIAARGIHALAALAGPLSTTAIISSKLLRLPRKNASSHCAIDGARMPVVRRSHPGASFQLAFIINGAGTELHSSRMHRDILVRNLRDGKLRSSLQKDVKKSNFRIWCEFDI
jgi:hypothetical protein